MASNDCRALFEARGWLVLRGVIAGDELAEMNCMFDEVIAASDDGRRTGVTLQPNACRTHPALLRHLRDGVAATVAALLGASCVRLLQDALLLKPPASPSAIALHQDYSYTGFLDPPSMVSVGLALNDASAESGCLHVVDGSHSWGLVGDLQIFATGLQPDWGDRLSATQRDAVDRRRIALDVRAGDVTIHHCLTLHGSGSNTSAAPRKTIVTHLFNGACRLLPDRLPAEHRDRFSTDDDGQLTGPAFPQLYP